MIKSAYFVETAWFRVFIWLFFASHVLENGSIIIGLLSTPIYLLLFIAAFVGIKMEVLSLKQKDNPLSINAKLGSITLIVVYILYIGVYAYVGIGDLMTVI